MKHSRQLLSPLQCLSRVFFQRQATRQFSTRSNLQQPFYVRKPLQPKPVIFPDKLAEFTRDEAIDSKEVLVKNEDGDISEPQLLQDILRRIDRKTETIVLLTKPGTDETALVEVCEIQTLRVRIREREKAAKLQKLAAREKKPKQIEINWAISEHDLELKIKQMEQFIEKGKNVEMLLAPKKRARRASPEEADMVLKKIREKLVEIDAKETIPMEGQVMKQATMHIKKK